MPQELLDSYKIIKDTLFKTDNRYYFLTGGAGTGKTHTINRLKQDYKVVLLSSTAISALLIDGSTVHSFFNFSICNNIQELESYDNKNKNYIWYKRKTKNIKKTLFNAELLIIDEVSMISSSLLECIVYRLIEASSDIKVLFVGDLYQLPPINDKMVINHPIFYDITILNLNTIKRTEDNLLKEMNSSLREYKNIDKFKLFCKSLDREFEEGTIILTPTNKMSEEYNSKYYDENSSEEHVFYASSTKLLKEHVSDSEIKSFIKQAPLLEELKLKEGLRVIITKNSKNYYNGELGTIKEIDENIIVTKDSGEDVKIKLDSFSLNKYIDGDFVTVAEVLQYPLLLGYAITIHKSQGQGYSHINIDCKNLFLPQQLYVALSRATDSKNIAIKNLNDSIIKENREVKAYFKSRKVIDLE